MAQRIILLEGWRAALLAVAAGALSSFSLAPYHLSPILLITIPVVVWLMDGAVPAADSRFFLRRLWPAFRIGWCFGFGYFLQGFWWVGKAFLVDAEDFIYLLPVAVLALPAGLALFYGLAASLARLAWGDGWVRLAALACAFTILEFARGTVLTGLPWNTLGYALMPVPTLMQTSALVGLYGMTFLTLIIAAAPALQTDRRAWPFVVIAAFLFVAHLGYGALVLSGTDDGVVKDVKLRIVQPAIDQSEKWEIENEPEIMARYLSLSNSDRGPDAAAVSAFTHLVWPESAFPFILTQRRDRLAEIANLLPPTTTLITGAMRLEQPTANEPRGRVFNALLAINGDGEIVEARDKTRLLPFGEFLPFQGFLESIGLEQLTKQRGGFAQGRRRQTVSLPNTPTFLPLICYEIIFSGNVARDSGERPEWIVNLTNDAWFGMTAGPYQHAHQAQVRAVEEGLPVVRAANNGISFVTDARGRIINRLALGERGVVDAVLPKSAPRTFFSIFGNVPVLVFVCLFYFVLIGVARHNTEKL